MNNHTLLEILQDKRVQKLITIGISLTGCKTKENIIERIKEQLKGKEGPSEKWEQLEMEL